MCSFFFFSRAVYDYVDDNLADAMDEMEKEMLKVLIALLSLLYDAVLT